MNESRLKELLSTLYAGEKLAEAHQAVLALAGRFSGVSHPVFPALSQRDVMLICYGDAILREGELPLVTLNRFLRAHCAGQITNVHLLPCFPFTSDDGFSVSDYLSIDPALGTWEDVETLSGSFGVMLDAVVNHTSKSHPWFRRCLAGESPYRHYYIQCDPAADYSHVTRPRALPLLSEFETGQGKKLYWTTFSQDQVDVNFVSPLLLAEMLNILLTYAARGARFIRLDAIGFAWKTAGSTCINLPQAHALVKIFRLVTESVFPGLKLITETNVPHIENIAYFGDADEAHLVYQFPLPPLTLYTMLTGCTTALSRWVDRLEKTPLKPGTTYFNFLASHDGIGVRPVMGILSDTEQKTLFEAAAAHGGRISYKDNGDGTSSPYELNISYMDAVTDPACGDDELRCARFLASQAVMLSLQGMPGIYYHSLLGSRNWVRGVNESGINRRINREKLDSDQLEQEFRSRGGLRYRVLEGYKRLLDARSGQSAFSPYAKQAVCFDDERVFALERMNRKAGTQVSVRINVSGDCVALREPVTGLDLFRGQIVELRVLSPYEIRWIARS